MTATKEELACVYAALILQDDEVGITADKLNAIIKAANVDVEPFWAGLFAKALEGVDVKGLITNISSGVGAAPAASAAPAAAAVSDEKKGGDKKVDKKEDKKPQKEESEDEDMGFGLFD